MNTPRTGSPDSIRIATSRHPVPAGGFLPHHGTNWIIRQESGQYARCPIMPDHYTDPLAHTGLPVWNRDQKAITPIGLTLKITVRRESYLPGHGSASIVAARTPERQHGITHPTVRRGTQVTTASRDNLQRLAELLPQFPHSSNPFTSGTLYVSAYPRTGQLGDRVSPRPLSIHHVALTVGCDRYLRVNGARGDKIPPSNMFLTPAALQEFAALTMLDLALPIDWYL